VFIRRLSIVGFGCLQNVTYDFPSGGLLILGPNESGKSTVVRSIEALLFGYQPKVAGPWRPWEGAEFAGELELAGDNGSLRVKRSFADNQATVTRRDSRGDTTDQPLGPVKLPPRGTTHERALYGRWLSAAIGVGSADLLRRTLYVPQGSLEVDVGDLDGVLRSYMTGGGLDVDAVARTLAERRRSVAQVSREGRANLGELDTLRLSLERAREELAEAERREGRLEELRTELSRLSTELGTQQAEHDRLADLLRTADRAQQLLETTARLEELLARDRQDQERDAERRTRLAALVEQITEHHDLVENAEAIRSGLARVERAGESAALARERLDAVGAAGSDGGWARPLVAAGIVGAIGAAVGALVAGWLGGGLGLALGVLLGLAVAWWLVVHRPRAAERALRQQDLASSQEGLQQAVDDLAYLVPGIPRDQFADLAGRLDELRELARHRADLEASLLSDSDLKALNGRVEARASELEAVRKELEAVQKTLAEAGFQEGEELGAARQRHRELGREVQEGTQRMQSLREEAAELRGAQGRAAAVLAEEVQELEEREEELAGRFRGLLLAEEVWGEAVRRFQETYLERYAERVGAWFRDLSGGAYGLVRLDSEGGTPEARREEDGRWVPVERLSQGAKDRLYLSLRLALAEVMAKQGVVGPLILDDPFVTFDADRRADAFETLRRLAVHRQVILLAHDEVYRELGWPVWTCPTEPCRREKASEACSVCARLPGPGGVYAQAGAGVGGTGFSAGGPRDPLGRTAQADVRSAVPASPLHRRRSRRAASTGSDGWCRTPGRDARLLPGQGVRPPTGTGRVPLRRRQRPAACRERRRDPLLGG